MVRGFFEGRGFGVEDDDELEDELEESEDVEEEEDVEDVEDEDEDEDEVDDVSDSDPLSASTVFTGGLTARGFTTTAACMCFLATEACSLGAWDLFRFRSWDSTAKRA